MAYMVSLGYTFSLRTRKIYNDPWVDAPRGVNFIGPLSPDCFHRLSWGVSLVTDTINGGVVPRKFKTPEDAEAYARSAYSDYILRNEYRVLVEKFSDRNWKYREASRIEHHYAMVPWADEPWANREETEFHFPHYAEGDKSKLAYTENDAKGRLDIQLVTKPGRYLRKFYGDVLSNDEIEAWTQKWAGFEDWSISFAETADEMEDVYTRGPSSCMSYDAEDFDSDVHPVRVYAAGDLKLAYLERGGRVTARALVWPDKMKYGRVYGDAGRFEPKLQDLGYTSGSLTGAKLLRISHDGDRLVMPYIDGCQSFTDHGDYCTIGGDLDAEQTNGLSGPVFICDNCGEPGDEEYSSYIDSCNERWCSHCTDNGAFYCEEINEMVADVDGIRLADGTLVSEQNFERNGGWTCALSGESHMDDDYVIVGADPVHTDYIGDGVEQCQFDDEYYYTTDMQQVTLANGADIWLHDDHVEQYKVDNPEQFEDLFTHAGLVEAA